MGPDVLKFPLEFDDLSGMNVLIRKVWSGDFLRLKQSHCDWCRRRSLGLRLWYGYILLLGNLFRLVLVLLRYGIVVISAVEGPWCLSWVSDFQHGMRNWQPLLALLTEVIVVPEGTLVSNSDDRLHVTAITSDMPVNDSLLCRLSHPLPAAALELFGLLLAVLLNLLLNFTLELGEEIA